MHAHTAAITTMNDVHCWQQDTVWLPVVIHSVIGSLVVQQCMQLTVAVAQQLAAVLHSCGTILFMPTTYWLSTQPSPSNDCRHWCGLQASQGGCRQRHALQLRDYAGPCMLAALALVLFCCALLAKVCTFCQFLQCALHALSHVLQECLCQKHTG